MISFPVADKGSLHLSSQARLIRWATSTWCQDGGVTQNVSRWRHPFCAGDEDDAVVFCGLRARDFAAPERREALLKLTEEEKIACPLVFLSEAGVAALSLVRTANGLRQCPPCGTRTQLLGPSRICNCIAWSFAPNARYPCPNARHSLPKGLQKQVLSVKVLFVSPRGKSRGI